LQRVPNISAAVKKITIRTLKMLFWGVLLQGNSFITMILVCSLIPLPVLVERFDDMYKGGYSHAPDDLSYGVDMKKIRWCGILQVHFIHQ